LGRAVHDVGQNIDADVERHGGDEERLVTLERLARAARDRIGEELALSGGFTPLENPAAREKAGGAREEMMLAAFAVVLDEQLLGARAVPVRLGEAARLGGLALDAQRVVQRCAHVLLMRPESGP